MNYYRRYIGDYHKKTMSLTPTDHGVYDLMLDFYYAEEKPLPSEMDDILAICKAIRPGDRKSVAKVLAAYFWLADDGYHNERADEEIAAAQQARANGKKHVGSENGTEDVTGEATGPPTGMLTGRATEMVSGLVHPPTTNHQPPTKTILQPPTKPSASSDKSLSAGGLVNGFAKIPLANRREWTVSSEYLQELETAYPAVDGPATLREIRAWCVSNPSKCKTEIGVPRFINRWFEKVQNGS